MLFVMLKKFFDDGFGIIFIFYKFVEVMVLFYWVVVLCGGCKVVDLVMVDSL